MMMIIIITAIIIITNASSWIIDSTSILISLWNYFLASRRNTKSG
jgi:hypothetical protein